MHAIAFGSKRVFHGLLRVTRKPLSSIGLTAARFDLLSALAGPRLQLGGAEAQFELVQTLGVSPPVVSRMLKALEKLGLVKRVRMDEDRRFKLVFLTNKGFALLCEARGIVLGPVRRLIEKALSGRRRCSLPIARIHVGTVDGYLWRLRRGTGDRASVDYPWQRAA